MRGALALEAAAETDRFAIGAATLSLLAASAEDAPVLVAIDDAQWLDEASLGAILFATRRLLADSVAVLFAARTAEAATLREAGLPELELSGLDRETASALLERHAGKPLAPDTAERLFEATAGNPLALVELAPAADAAPATERSPAIETSVERAFGRRLRRLSSPAGRALLLAAADEAGGIAVLERAAPALGIELGALQEAETDGLVSISAGTVSFCHPLARTAAYRSASQAQRRAVHRALAAALSDQPESDRRAWHLAAGGLGTDPEAAGALEDAGSRARRRSAYASAATAFERAARLTAAGPDRARRLVAAAEAATHAGHAERASPLLG